MPAALTKLLFFIFKISPARPWLAASSPIQRDWRSGEKLPTKLTKHHSCSGSIGSSKNGPLNSVWKEMFILEMLVRCPLISRNKTNTVITETDRKSLWLSEPFHFHHRNTQLIDLFFYWWRKESDSYNFLKTSQHFDRRHTLQNNNTDGMCILSENCSDLYTSPSTNIVIWQVKTAQTDTFVTKILTVL